MKMNYCNSSGLMSVCKMANNIIGQQLCEFSVPATSLNMNENKYCMHLGKAVENHCDSPNAQWDAKCGGKDYVAPLSEEEIFDVTNRDTYPEYREEGGDLYL